MDSLSSDVASCIFKYFHRDDAIQTMQVNRFWSSIASSHSSYRRATFPPVGAEFDICEFRVWQWKHDPIQLTLAQLVSGGLHRSRILEHEWSIEIIPDHSSDRITPLVDVLVAARQLSLVRALRVWLPIRTEFHPDERSYFFMLIKLLELWAPNLIIFEGRSDDPRRPIDRIDGDGGETYRKIHTLAPIFKQLRICISPFIIEFCRSDAILLWCTIHSVPGVSKPDPTMHPPMSAFLKDENVEDRPFRTDYGLPTEWKRELTIGRGEFNRAQDATELASLQAFFNQELTIHFELQELSLRLVNGIETFLDLGERKRLDLTSIRTAASMLRILRYCSYEDTWAHNDASPLVRPPFLEELLRLAEETPIEKSGASSSSSLAHSTQLFPRLTQLDIVIDLTRTYSQQPKSHPTLDPMMCQQLAKTFPLLRSMRLGGLSPPQDMCGVFQQLTHLELPFSCMFDGTWYTNLKQIRSLLLSVVLNARQLESLHLHLHPRWHSCRYELVDALMPLVLSSAQLTRVSIEDASTWYSVNTIVFQSDVQRQLHRWHLLWNHLQPSHQVPSFGLLGDAAAKSIAFPFYPRSVQYYLRLLARQKPDPTILTLLADRLPRWLRDSRAMVSVGGWWRRYQEARNIQQRADEVIRMSQSVQDLLHEHHREEIAPRTFLFEFKEATPKMQF